jgi:hypothetical protein
MMDREVFVYFDLQGEPILVGRLGSRIRKGRESASFEYDPSWLEHLRALCAGARVDACAGAIPHATGEGAFWCDG